MTRDERNHKLKKYIECLKCEVSGKCCDDNCPTQYEAGNMGEIIENLEAISKLLEQEPCEDCISREAVNDGFKKYDSGSFAYGCVWDYINKLPSVTPKEKSEYEHDHEVVKAYNDGQEFILDKIRAEIELHRRKTESIDTYDLVGDCLEIIDKYRQEG